MEQVCLEQNKPQKLHGFKFWKSIGSPQYVCAPMEHQSELPFRILVKKYGCQLTYTPMLHSRLSIEHEKYLKQNFSTCQEERPVFAQFNGHDPKVILEAAKKIQHQVDAIDINFGCPQGIAKKGRYGAFLLSEPETIENIVKTLHEGLDIPVTCKIRILQDEQKTLDLVKRIEKAGCSVLTVHGRTKEQNKDFQGSANWDIIKKIKETVSIPVIANGGIFSFEDVQKCLEYTNCDAVMSSEALLENPALFSGKILDLDDLALEYLETSNKYSPVGGNMKSHLFKFFYQGFKDPKNYDLRDKLSKVSEFDDLYQIAVEMKNRRNDLEPQQKLGWYFRYQQEAEARKQKKMQQEQEKQMSQIEQNKQSQNEQTKQEDQNNQINQINQNCDDNKNEKK